MSEWISVKDMVPAETQWVLVSAGGAVNCMAWHEGSWQNWGECTNLQVEDITHWQPLPESPKQSGHTPGPWGFWSGYNPADVFEAQITAEDGDIVIANYNYLIDQGEANARLMSSAPRLLSALEGAVAFINSHVADPDITAEMRDAYSRYLEEDAPAVIAAAKGDQP